MDGRSRSTSIAPDAIQEISRLLVPRPAMSALAESGRARRCRRRRVLGVLRVMRSGASPSSGGGRGRTVDGSGPLG